MQIRIVQSDVEYPFANVFVEGANLLGPMNVQYILADRGITLLGPWKLTDVDVTAPALLEYEHRKPSKYAR